LEVEHARRSLAGALASWMNRMRSRSEKIVAGFLLVSGGISVLLGALGGWLIATGRDPMGGGLVRVIGWGVALAVFAAMVVGGMLLMRRSQLAHWFVPAVLAIQVPVVEVGHFSYAIISFPRIEWGLWPGMIIS